MSRLAASMALVTRSADESGAVWKAEPLLRSNVTSTGAGLLSAAAFGSHEACALPIRELSTTRFGTLKPLFLTASACQGTQPAPNYTSMSKSGSGDECCTEYSVRWSVNISEACQDADYGQG